ncbi:hypothetical protein CLOP_g1349 [Closterium sp. NIES-67]|nr:hypothetical protein CLOP_g21382 [Closterium sp. NIES-67]GJP70404.1 hypothetical protein CLOP_g1349 [Closterium sp. NIES-67]
MWEREEGEVEERREERGGERREEEGGKGSARLEGEEAAEAAGEAGLLETGLPGDVKPCRNASGAADTAATAGEVGGENETIDGQRQAGGKKRKRGKSGKAGAAAAGFAGWGGWGGATPMEGESDSGAGAPSASAGFRACEPGPAAISALNHKCMVQRWTAVYSDRSIPMWGDRTEVAFESTQESPMVQRWTAVCSGRAEVQLGTVEQDTAALSDCNGSKALENEGTDAVTDVVADAVTDGDNSCLASDVLSNGATGGDASGALAPDSSNTGINAGINAGINSGIKDYGFSTFCMDCVVQASDGSTVVKVAGQSMPSKRAAKQWTAAAVLRALASKEWALPLMGTR